jgi:hypothetical protein
MIEKDVLAISVMEITPQFIRLFNHFFSREGCGRASEMTSPDNDDCA